ncbi:DUF2079 domain-containing protein [Streptomyces sp. CA-111067]|uniref:DUF2079 domain-containing protein n=1 Tax=Streptomyces sp. CA-111067 TaxID=3240046 RepID=UPI003D9802F7
MHGESETAEAEAATVAPALDTEAVLPAQDAAGPPPPTAQATTQDTGLTPGPADTGDAHSRTRAAAPWLLAAAFSALYAALSISRYRQMRTMSWDLGIFEQAVKSYAHLHAPVADLKGPGFNVLGDHFSPITALIAPFYRLFPTPVTLLVAQALLFALSVVPVTRAAGRVFGTRAGLAVGAAYGLSWGIQRAVDFDFHEVAFAVPMLAFALEAVLRGRWTAAMWWAVPLTLVKEDMGATVAALAAVVWLRSARATTRGGANVRTYAVMLAVFGAAASVLEIRRLMPAFHGPGYHLLNHIDGAGTLTGHIPADTAVRTLLWLLLPAGGLLALRSPLLLVALPTLGWRFVSHEPADWGTAWHYNAVLMPVVFLALVDAAERIVRSSPRTSRRPRQPLSSRRAPLRPFLRSYAAAAPVATVAAALALSTQLPLASLSHPAAYRVDARTKAVVGLLDRIPNGATVEANVGPISRLVRRTTVYWVGGTKGVTPDYLALEDSSGWVPDPVGYARQLHPAARYVMVGSAGGYVLLRHERAAG